MNSNVSFYKRNDYIKNHFLTAEKKTIVGNILPHTHDYFELECFITGSGTHIIDDVSYPIQPYSIFLLTPASIHSMQNLQDINIVTIMFQVEYEKNAFTFPIPPLTASPAFFLNKPDTDFLFPAILELVKVQKANIDLAMHLLYCILSKLTMLCQPKDSVLPLTQRIMLYMLEHFKEEITLASTASHFGYSAAYLSDFFVKQTGTNFKKYLNNIRFSHAENLLRFTDMSITEVQANAGFSNYANFAKQFKLTFGKSPTEYRKTFMEI